MGEPILPVNQICRKKTRAKGSTQSFRKWLAKKFKARPSKKDELIIHLRERLSAFKVHCTVLDNRIHQLQRTDVSRSRRFREIQHELRVAKVQIKKLSAELAQALVSLANEQVAHSVLKDVTASEASRLLASSDLLRSEYLRTSSDLKRTEVELTRTRQDAVDLQLEVNSGLAALEGERSKVEELRAEQRKTEMERASLCVGLITAHNNLGLAQEELSSEKEDKERLQLSMNTVQEENLRLKEQLEEICAALNRSRAEAMRDQAALANAKLSDTSAQLVSTREELTVTKNDLDDLKGKLAIVETDVEASDAEILEWKVIYAEYNDRTGEGFKEKDAIILDLREQLARVAKENEGLKGSLNESNRKLEFTITCLQNHTADSATKDIAIEEGQQQLTATNQELEETKRKLSHTINGIRALNTTLGDTKKELRDTALALQGYKEETSRAIADLNSDVEELKAELLRAQDDLVASRDQAASLAAQLAQTRENAASECLEQEISLAEARAHLALSQDDLVFTKEKLDSLIVQLSEKDTALDKIESTLACQLSRNDILQDQLDQAVQQNALTVVQNTQLNCTVESLRSDLALASNNLESERSVRRALEQNMSSMIELMNIDISQIEKSKRVIEEQLAVKVIRCKELEKLGLQESSG